MGLSCVGAGIEQPDHLARSWIEAGKVRAFRPIASIARQCQVERIVRPTVLLGVDVFNVKGKKRGVALAQPTILTAIASALPHEVP